MLMSKSLAIRLWYFTSAFYIFDSFDAVAAFRPILLPQHCSQRSTTPSHLTWLKATPSRDSDFVLRRGIKLPLLDVPDTTSSDPSASKNDNPHALRPLVVIPLPSDHLPDELRDLNVYGMELSRPVHKLIMEDAMARAEKQTVLLDGSRPSRPVYGHIAWKEGDSLEGAVGCASEILLQADGGTIQATRGRRPVADDGGDTPPTTVVSCGAFRFVVKEVVQTVPFPIAIVDELADVEPGGKVAIAVTDDDEEEDDDDDEEDDDDYDLYCDLGPTELMQQLFQGMKAFVDQTIEKTQTPKQMSPLEQAILEDTGMAPDVDPAATEYARAEQIAATFITFQSSLGDICTTKMERYYAVGMFAAELVDLNNAVRRQILAMSDGVERMRVVLREMNTAMAMARARIMANEITESKDKESRDLKVGQAELPPWSKRINKGTRVEYFWNEEWEWCAGEVVEDPVMVVDELLLTIQFDEDEPGVVQKLPFSADEKARWRPA